MGNDGNAAADPARPGSSAENDAALTRRIISYVLFTFIVYLAIGLGLLFPPSLPLILFAIVAASNATGAGVTIEKMFLAGFGPGVLLVGMAIWLGMRLGPKSTGIHRAVRPGRGGPRGLGGKMGTAAAGRRAGGVVRGIGHAGGSRGGHGALRIRGGDVCLSRFQAGERNSARHGGGGLLVGGVLLILGVALGFTNYLVDAQVPDPRGGMGHRGCQSKYAFLLALNLCLLAVGCLMDMYSAIIVVAPLIVPLAMAYGVDPVHQQTHI